MNDMTTSRAPAWYRIVTVLAILWNLMGLYVFLVSVGAVASPPMDPAEQAIADTMPTWTTAAFAIGVFSGLVGSLGLLLLKGWSRMLLLLSLVALAVLEGWWIFLSGGPEALGPSTYIVPILVVVIALLLWWLANMGAKKGWLS
ncbi:MAG: hypothetical protein ACT4OE_05315 [Sphingosinicella sp.]